MGLPGTDFFIRLLRSVSKFRNVSFEDQINLCGERWEINLLGLLLLGNLSNRGYKNTF